MTTLINQAYQTTRGETLAAERRRADAWESGWSAGWWGGYLAGLATAATLAALAWSIFGGGGTP